MPNLPTKRSYGYGAQAFGQGIAQFGAGIVNIASEMQQRQKELVDAAAQAQFADARAQSIKAYNEFEFDLASDPDYENYNMKFADFDKALSERMQPILTLKKAQDAYANWHAQAGSEAMLGVGKLARQKLQGYTKAVLYRNLDQYARDGEWELAEQEIAEALQAGYISGDEAIQAGQTYLSEARKTAVFTELSQMPFEKAAGLLATQDFDLTGPEITDVKTRLQLRDGMAKLEAQARQQEVWDAAEEKFWTDVVDRSKWAGYATNPKQLYDLMYAGDPERISEKMATIDKILKGEEPTDNPASVDEIALFAWDPSKSYAEKIEFIRQKLKDGKITGPTARSWWGTVDMYNQDDEKSSLVASLMDGFNNAIQGAAGNTELIAKLRARALTAGRLMQQVFLDYPESTAENKRLWETTAQKLVSEEGYQEVLDSVKEQFGYQWQMNMPEIFKAESLREMGAETPETKSALASGLAKLETEDKRVIRDRLPKNVEISTTKWQTVLFEHKEVAENVYYTKEPKYNTNGELDFTGYGVDWWAFIVRHVVVKGGRRVHIKPYLYNPNSGEFDILLDKWDDAKTGLQESGWIRK